MKVRKHVLGVAAALGTIASVHGATYEVIELDTTQISLNAFATGIGEDGLVSFLATGQANGPVIGFTGEVVNYGPGNPIIDLSLVNFSDTLIAQLEDPDSAMQGIFTQADYITILTTAILPGQAGLRTQRIGRFESYIGDENGIARVPVFDQFDQDLGDITRSTSTFINSITNEGLFVGEAGAPYTKESYVNEDNEDELYVVRAFAERGFVSFDGEIIELLSPAQDGGGWSQALAVNNQRAVVGNVAAESLEGFVTDIEECTDDAVERDIPFNSCVTDLLDDIIASGTGGFSNVFDASEEVFDFTVRGAVWQLSESGEVQSLTILDPLRLPDEEAGENFIAQSRATAINDSGIVIGRSIDEVGDTGFFLSFGVVYDENGTPSHISDNSDETLLGSNVVDINNSNIIVGTEVRRILDLNTNVFFVHDLNNNETTHPQLFFEQTDTRVTDINDQGQVVGDAQFELVNNRVRRRAGFLYNVNDDITFNLNELDSCDSPYNIINAEAINEAGEIAATGLVTRQARDPLTLELEVDEAGDPVMEEVSVALKLIPIPGGEIEDCNGGGAGTVEPLERQGASLFYLVFMLLGAGAFKIRANKKH